MKYVNGDGSVKSDERAAVANGNDTEDPCIANVTPKKLSKSYVYQSEHSLVAVLRRQSISGVDEDDDEGSWGSDDSEAALTRVTRVCWAVCCCKRSPCCLDEEELGETATAASEEDVHQTKRKCSPFSVVSIVGTQFLLLRQKLEFAEHG